VIVTVFAIVAIAIVVVIGLLAVFAALGGDWTRGPHR